LTQLANRGIRRSYTVHDAPEHNGIVERANYTIVDLARAMLVDQGLPKKLSEQGSTPFEAVKKVKPDLSKAQRWGCRVIVRLKRLPGTKLSARGAEARWIGPSLNTVDGHIVYWPTSGKVTVERDIRFVDTPAFEGEDDGEFDGQESLQTPHERAVSNVERQTLRQMKLITSSIPLSSRP